MRPGRSHHRQHRITDSSRRSSSGGWRRLRTPPRRRVVRGCHVCIGRPEPLRTRCRSRGHAENVRTNNARPHRPLSLWWFRVLDDHLHMGTLAFGTDRSNDRSSMHMALELLRICDLEWEDLPRLVFSEDGLVTNLWRGAGGSYGLFTISRRTSYRWRQFWAIIPLQFRISASRIAARYLDDFRRVGRGSS